MTETTDPLSLLSRAAEQTAAVLAGVRKDQADLPTQLPAWSIGQLIDHVVNNLRLFTIAAQGGERDFTAPAAKVDDWVGEFRARQRELIEAWNKAGDLSATVEVPGMGLITKRFSVEQQTAELAVHTWDLARASGQSTDLDPEIAAASLEWAKGALRPEFRSTEPNAAFKPEIPIADDAPVCDRLAAFFGRNPG